MTTAIKIQLVKVVPMSAAGGRQWRPHTRAALYHWVFKAQPLLGHIPIADLRSKKLICDLVWRHGGPGMWDVRSPCPTRNKMHFSMRTLVRVTLSVTSDNEYAYEITEWQPMRLRRYKKILGWKDDESIY
jgi:hypothetical protein